MPPADPRRSHPEWSAFQAVATRGAVAARPGTAYQILHRILDDVGLPRVRFHALRHAFATTLLVDGEDLANVSKLVGHRDLATTANVYVHLSDQASWRAADRMNKALRRAQ